MSSMKMNRAVRTDDGEVFVPGDEERLDKALTSEQVKRLKRKNAISGGFKGQREEGEPAERPEGDEGSLDATVRAGGQARSEREKLRKEGAKRAANKEAPAADEPEPLNISGEGEPLDDEFPARGELEKAGLNTREDVQANLDRLEELDGIGTTKAKQIREHVGSDA